MDFINTMTFAQILSEVEENAKLVFHETNLAFPVKDEDIVEEIKVSKKTRRNHSYNKGERAQMKKDSAMKRAKALGIGGNPEEGSDFYIVLKKAKRNMNAKEKGRHFYNTVEKCGHAVDFSREEKRRNAEKRLMRVKEYEPDYDLYDYKKYLAGAKLHEAGFEKLMREEAIADKIKEIQKAHEKLQMLKLYCSNLEEDLDWLQMQYDDAVEFYNSARYDYDAISLWE